METGMDNFKTRQSLLGAVDGAVSTFSELFEESSYIQDMDIAPGRSEKAVVDYEQTGVNSYQSRSNSKITNVTSISNHVTECLNSSNTTISPDSLTRSQFQSIQHLFRHLSKVKSCSEKLHLLFHHGSKKAPLENGDDDIDIIEAKLEVEKLQNEAVESKKREGKHLKIICALRDYLMIEINRSEGSDKELKNVEDNLLKMTVERNKYMKMAQQLQLNNMKGGEKCSSEGKDQILRKSDVAPVVFNTEMPELYCGCFVRKKFGSNYFFGLIAYFDFPFFKVVYEDCDTEEMNFRDLSLSFWASSVPSTKSAQCKRHAAALGLNVISCEFEPEVAGPAGRVSSSISRTVSSTSSYSVSDGGDGDADLKVETSASSGASNSSSSSSSSSVTSSRSHKKRPLPTGEALLEKRSCLISTRYRGLRNGGAEKSVANEVHVVDDWCLGDVIVGVKSRAKEGAVNIDLSRSGSGDTLSPNSKRFTAENISSSQTNPIDLSAPSDDETAVETGDLAFPEISHSTGDLPFPEIFPEISEGSVDLAFPEVSKSSTSSILAVSEVSTPTSDGQEDALPKPSLV